jgi:hypothetical protein
MTRPLFLPSPRQAAWLCAIAIAALACGFYLRYRLIEQSTVGIACEAGLRSFSCAARKTAILLFTPGIFGGTALAAAALNLLRPSIVLCTVALLAGGFGIVLYNVAMSALSVALLTLSLARPAPEPE